MTKPTDPERFFFEYDAMMPSNGNDEDDWVRYKDARKWALDMYHEGVFDKNEVPKEQRVFPQSATDRLSGARCDECICFVKDEQGHECRFNPPVVVDWKRDAGTCVQFVPVRPDWWCGRFERREVKNDN